MLTPETFLSGYSPDLQQIAFALREVVAVTIPQVREKVYQGWNLIGYRVPCSKGDAYFAYIAPTADRVYLGFEYGILMLDPDRLLNGDGKQVRHIGYASVDDVRPAEIAPLIKEAAEIACLTGHEKAQLALEREAEREARRRGLFDR